MNSREDSHNGTADSFWIVVVGLRAHPLQLSWRNNPPYSPNSQAISSKPEVWRCGFHAGL